MQRPKIQDFSVIHFINSTINAPTQITSLKESRKDMEGTRL